VPITSSYIPCCGPSPPPTPDTSPAPGAAILPFRDVETDENVELVIESDEGEGDERENGIEVINPIACALRTVFRASFIPATLLNDPVRFLACSSRSPDAPVVDSEDIESEPDNASTPRASPGLSLPLIDARLERENPCSGWVCDILFPADRDGGSVADSGMAELWRSGRTWIVVVACLHVGLGLRGVGRGSRLMGVIVQSAVRGDMVRGKCRVQCRGCGD
jgi:hypothetical protein